MKKIFFFTIYIYVCIANVSAVNITDMDQLDSLAAFSFAIISDNKGFDDMYDDVDSTSHTRMVSWVSSNDEFCLGVGDHIFPYRDRFNGILLNNSFFHNHFYPVIGDWDNGTKLYYGSEGVKQDWGRGWVIFKSLNNFFNRPEVQFRPKQSSKVSSGGRLHDDQLIDYYATRQRAGFTVHIIGVHYGDSSAFAPRSKDFMISKLQSIAAVKTDRDVVVVLAHTKGNLFKNALSGGYMNQSEVDFVMNTADLVCDASVHVYRRHFDYDGRYDGNEALWINTGAVVGTGDTHGYVNCHVFDNPPRFTVQFIDCQRQSSRKLLIGPKPRHSATVTDAETVPHIKYVNGPFAPVNWSSFDHDGSAPPPPPPPPPPPLGDIMITKNSSWKYLDDGSNQGTGWRATGFNDGSWSSGNGALGYGDSGSQNTTVSYGSDAQNKHVTTYFRKSFNVSNASTYTALRVAVRRDDGVVVYLNGNEVVRDNMPSGSIAYNTLANGHAANADETTYHLFNISPSLLQEGNNVIAAEVHQDNRTSSDISFDLELSGDTAGAPPPPINSILGNASFEEGSASWIIGNSASVSTDTRQGGGSYSLKMVNSSSPTRQTVTLQPNTDYTLSAWVLASGLTAGNVIIDTDDVFDSASQTPGGSAQFVVNDSAAPVWTQFTGSFNSASVTSVTIRVFTSASPVGTAYVDNIELIASGSAEPPPPINSLLGNASFEEGTASWIMGNSASVSTDTRQGGGSYSLKMVNSSSPTRQAVTLQPNTDYTLRAWVLASGLTAGNVIIDTDDVFDSASQTPGGSAQFVVNASAAPVWTQFTGSFNSASVTSVTIRVFTSGSPSGTAYVDNIEIISVGGNPPPEDPFNDWKVVNNIVDDTGDDDADGIDNFTEFALDLDPNTEDISGMPEVVKNGNNFDYTFKRGQSSVSYVVEKSTDLVNWAVHATVDDSHGLVGSDATVSLTEGEMNNGKLFIRLRVEEQ